jgi:phage-related protein
MKWNIEFYETTTGASPVTDFIDPLSAREKAKIGRYIELLEEYGLTLREPYVKSIQGHRKLWELRIPVNPRTCRIFYFHYRENTLVMLHAFWKKAAKTPRKELDIADKRMKDYEERF